MSYAVKEIFYSLQGEGREAGRPAIFIRFMGCNLWSGREEDRLTSGTICHFCDTDFRAPAKESGGIFADAGELAQKALKLWPQSAGTKPYIIFTGGEPLLHSMKLSVKPAMQPEPPLPAKPTAPLPLPCPSTG